ncbi:39354_t:CDS:2, partial [Gigaspora margarita]
QIFKLIKDSKMTKRKQKQNNDSNNTDTETESRNSNSSKLGRPSTGVWNFFKRGQPKGDGHWEGTCDYCGTFYPHAKPQNLRAHLANNCKKVPEEWRRHFNYIIANNLEDIPTDEPLSNATSSLFKQKKIAKQPALTNWYDSATIDASRQLLIDEAITLAFIMCGIPFRVINNPFFVSALNLLNPGYSVPSREVLSGRLLDTEVAKVIHKVDKILEHASNLAIGLDGWTAPNGLSIWNFVIMTPSRQEYLYELANYSDQSHTGEFLANQIELIINRIGKDKISAIISDNGSNVASARRIICSKYRNILNIRCIAHCFNLISKDIIRHTFAEKIIQRANKLVGFFKKSHKAAAILNQKILQYQVSGGGLKTYVETRWTTVHECVSSIVRLKNCLEEIRENHSEFISPTILAILRSRGFFIDMQYLSDVLLPIREAILAVEANCAGLKFGTFPLIANYAGRVWQQMGKQSKSCETLITQLRIYKEQKKFINGIPNPYTAPYTIGNDTPLMWWNTCEVKPNHLQRLAIKLFSITPSSAICERMFSALGWIYGKHRTRLNVDRLEGLAKVYRFNLSNPIEQLRHTQITEVTPEIMTNIAETVFK